MGRTSPVSATVCPKVTCCGAAAPVTRAVVHAAPAVLVRDLVKRFPRATALDGISFELRSGEVLGLLGPNGAGKTTTLHILLGLVRPTAGCVRLFGRDPHDGTKAALE